MRHLQQRSFRQTAAVGLGLAHVRGRAVAAGAGSRVAGNTCAAECSCTACDAHSVLLPPGLGQLNGCGLCVSLCHVLCYRFRAGT